MKNRRPLLIQGAMDSETDIMIESLADVRTQTLHGYAFAAGALSGHPVVISKTGAGMANAAAATAVGIMAFAPIALINQGTAGGHDPALHQGDIVVGTQIIHIGAFMTDWADVGAGIHPENWHMRRTHLGATDRVTALQSDPSLVQIAERAADAQGLGAVHLGTIGSSDMFNRELDRIHQLRAQFGTSCEEMEAFAAAQVCALMGVPFLGIRVISNNELHQESFDAGTGASCQAYVLEVANLMLPSTHP